jgi:antitoxin (DNA-binding transcriptional repressor) of toxin-antitoxin stability system
MPISATKARADLLRLLDQVIETGQPVEILRKGRAVRIVLADSASKADWVKRLAPRPGYVVGDPDDLVHLDWSDGWRP